ncbi:MAG: hypothetical protein HC936_17105 [Leptolyngbyaceae cyanobacterium SU_3_3]|nr:hypothetical protein [Leptolyngbyaceae cyanobacterium SU_3_3]
MADNTALRLQEIARQLEQDASAMRIKKLMLYACKNWWETDPDILAVTDLENWCRSCRCSIRL